MESSLDYFCLWVFCLKGVVKVDIMTRIVKEKVEQK
jgi:hypothetical protein